MGFLVVLLFFPEGITLACMHDLNAILKLHVDLHGMYTSKLCIAVFKKMHRTSGWRGVVQLEHCENVLLQQDFLGKA